MYIPCHPKFFKFISSFLSCEKFLEINDIIRMNVKKYFIIPNLIIFVLLFNVHISISQNLILSHSIHSKKSIISENLILHLDASNPNSLNQNDLSSWNDLTSNNNDLSLFSGTMEFSSDAGGSLVFNNDIYRRSSNLNNMSHSNISISIWIKTTSSSNAFILSLSRTPSDFKKEFIFRISSGKVNFWDYSTAHGFPQGNSNTTQTSVNDGNWKFITFTKDITSGRYYINAVSDNINPSTSPLNVNYGNDNFIIGKNWRDNNNIFVGSIGAVYLYTKTLSQDEITQNYNATKSRYGH